MGQNAKQERYYIPTPLQVQPHFSFVNVFRESTQYCRIYDLPFLCVSTCLRENPDDPSSSVNLKTGEVNVFHENDIRLVLPGARNRRSCRGPGRRIPYCRAAAGCRDRSCGPAG